MKSCRKKVSFHKSSNGSGTVLGRRLQFENRLPLPQLALPKNRLHLQPDRFYLRQQSSTAVSLANTAVGLPLAEVEVPPSISSFFPCHVVLHPRKPRFLESPILPRRCMNPKRKWNPLKRGSRALPRERRAMNGLLARHLSSTKIALV